MAGGKRRRTQWLADLLIDYGGASGLGPFDYETVVGLVMNAPRARLRRVYQEGLAITLAASRDEIPYDVVAAACATQAEADRLFFEINAARHRAQHGF